MQPQPVIDPLQILLQGGGFALACFLVIWITKTQTTILSTLTQTVADNTRVLSELKNAIENNFELRHKGNRHE